MRREKDVARRRPNIFPYAARPCWGPVVYVVIRQSGHYDKVYKL